MDTVYVPFKEANSFYGNLYGFFADLSFWGVEPIPDWLAYLLAGFLIVFSVIAWSDRFLCNCVEL